MEKLLAEIQDNIDYINKNFKYTNFIHKLIFDNYANITKDEVLNFTFPLTALVGKNGCNKTRVLQALYGVPEGKTVGDFWFSTSLDPIDDRDPERGNARYIYVYSTDKDENEKFPVHYNRTRRENDPDYWETRALTQTLKTEYDIPKEIKRCDPIKKNCIFIDSKIELSAYDIFFNFNGRETGKRTNYRENKRFIRKKSGYIKRNIEKKNIRPSAYKKPQNEKPIELTNQHLQWISRILGKDYAEIIQIFHKHYKFWGDSLFLNQEYSEARAGSGELKVVNIVRQILDAEHHSLILLDEPEISLHPGAQLQLLNFFLDQIRKKNHQIVFTTHSPTIIKYLPSTAIRLFTKNMGEKSFSIKENISSVVAFSEFGEPIAQKKNIFVEDETAKLILETVIQASEILTGEAFNILYTPGGANDLIVSTLPNIMFSPENMFVIFDGDQNRRSDNLDYKKIPLDKSHNEEQFKTELKRIIFGLTGTNSENIRFAKNSSQTTKEDNNIFLNFLKFFDSNVFFLPQMLPEDIIWNTNVDSPLFQVDKKMLASIDSDTTKNSKKKLYAYAAFLSNGNNNDAGQLYTVLRTQLLKYFSDIKNNDFKAIEIMLESIQNS